MFTLVNKNLEKLKLNYFESTNEIDCSNLFLTTIKEFYLIIDSLYDHIDLIPQKDILILDNHTMKFIGDLANTDIVTRYSNTTTEEGINKVKKLYDKMIEDDIKNKKIAVFSLCPTYSCNMASTYCYQKNYERSVDSMDMNKESVCMREKETFIDFINSLYKPHIEGLLNSLNE